MKPAKNCTLALNYKLAEDMFVSQGMPLDKIIPAFTQRLSLRILQDWKKEYAWDDKRKSYVERNLALIEETRELVTISLGFAKAEPTAANITAFKRAIEALMALQKNVSAPEEEDENSESDLTPEKLDEFARKAGLR